MIRTRDIEEKLQNKLDPIAIRVLVAMAEEINNHTSQIIALATLLDKYTDIVLQLQHVMGIQQTELSSAKKRLEVLDGPDEDPDNPIKPN